MNKNVLIAAIVVLVAAVGYYQFSYAPAQRAATEAAAAEEAATAAATAAEEAAAAAAAEAEAAAAAAAEEAAAAATTATEAVTDAMPALDAATFDPVAIAGMIDASALDDATKATLKAAVTAAGSDPAAITAVIAQVRTALGL